METGLKWQGIRNPRLPIEEVVFALFLKEMTVSEMVEYVKANLHAELERDEVISSVKSKMTQVSVGSTEEQRVLFSRLSKMLQPGLVKTDQPILPFLTAILQILNEQSLELVVKAQRGGKATAQVMFAFLESVKLLVALKRELETSILSVDHSEVINDYNYKVCELFVDSVNKVLADSKYTAIKKTLLADVLSRIEAMLKGFLETNAKPREPKAAN